MNAAVEDRKDSAQHSYGIAKIWHGVHELPRLSRTSLAAHLVSEAWRSLLATPLVSAITILTIAVSLLLLSGFILILQNVGQALSVSQADFALSIYLKDQADQAQVDELRALLTKQPEIAEIKYIDKQSALDEFSKSLGSDTSLLDGFAEHNPLPASLEVVLKPGSAERETFERIQSSVSQHGAVEKVQYSSGLISQFSSILKTFRNAGALAVLLMVLMVSSIICNTIRLALYSRREELEIMRLVGATRSFIRAPCLIEGVIQGVIGACLAVAALWLIFVAIQKTLLGSDVFNLIFPRLSFLSFQGILVVVFFGFLVGILGSHFSARPFLEEQQ